MTKRQARRLALSVLASDCYVHSAAGVLDPMVRDETDDRRLSEAFDKLRDEFSRRARGLEKDRLAHDFKVYIESCNQIEERNKVADETV